MTLQRYNPDTPFDRLARRREVPLAAEAKPSRAASRRSFSPEEQAILRQLMAEEQDYIDSPEFRKKDAERTLFERAPEIRKPDASWYHPVMDDIAGSRARLPKTTDQVILTGAEERVLFLQFNYSRHRIAEIQKVVNATDSRQPTAAQAREMLKWHGIAENLRVQIAETNLALVLAMAKRTRMSEVDFADLVSEGNMALLRAIDKFDCERGFKFSTYACRAILKAFSRQGMKLSKYRQRFPTDYDPKLERSNLLDTRRADLANDAASEVRRIVDENVAELTDIEKQVIEHRFRLHTPDDGKRPLTLEQVGHIIGVTKERVRQIQNKALEKIRIRLENDFFGNSIEEPEGEEHSQPPVAILN